MSAEQWKKLMAAWSKDVLRSELAARYGAVEQKPAYLGFEGASPEEIKDLEKRLGVALPPSYRAFLEATNGFGVISHFIYRLRPAAEVDWFVTENRGWAETSNEPTPYGDPDRPEMADEEYFDYEQPNELEFRAKELFGAVQISDVGDGVMLLNPQAVTPDGEWEAWFMANWIPGVRRYASFAHMMADEYRSLRESEELKGEMEIPKMDLPAPGVKRRSVIAAPVVPKPVGPIVKRKAGQTGEEYVAEFMEAAKAERVGPAPEELKSLLHELMLPDEKRREKAVLALAGRIKVRAVSERHPEFVPIVAELARSLPDPAARAVCVQLLTTITPDGPTPEWLQTALQDDDPRVRQAAAYAGFFFQ